MSDFQLLQNPVSKKWVILAPRRAKRPDEASGIEPVCPFCPGKESNDEEVYRVGGKDTDANWQIRVVQNRYPFAPIHEVIVHSPNHHKNFDELPLSQTELILQTYINRFKMYEKDGQVYIFHNRERGAGESLPHPHSQLAVLPFEVDLDIPRLATPMEMEAATKDQIFKETANFIIFCPKTSQWPDEVWIAPKERGNLFSSLMDKQVSDLAFILSRLIQILSLRHGAEFPFNFYIYPGGDWYMRIIPRLKVPGGFELGTGIFVNTQDPKETIEFIKEHFDHPNVEKIKTIHKAAYRRGV
jgi:UDPglucose--hexose-1-phosphate uridylyltransferase